MATKTNMSIKLDEDLRTRLHALGEARRRSPHWLMCEAVRAYLEREEEHEREHQITLERLAKYNDTGEYIAHEDMEKWLKSWGTPNELPPPTRIRVRNRPASK